MGLFEKLTRFFCACAPGIAIGLWSAHQLGFWWPVGAVIGALVSYLLVEWKENASAAARAYGKVASWQPDRVLWRYRGLIILGFLSMASSCSVLILGSIWLNSHMGPTSFFDSSLNDIPKTPLFSVVLGVFLMGVLCSFVACLWLFVGLMFSKALYLSDTGSDTGGFQTMSMEAIRFGNPLAVFFYWPVVGLWNSPKVIPWFFRSVGAGLAFCGRFIKEFLFIIHSRKRTLCAATTFITVVIGYVVDGDLIAFTLVGAAIGGLYSISSWRDWVIIKVQPQS